MSYHLENQQVTELTKSPAALDPDVLEVKVFVRPDHTGADVLQFRVVLKNSVKMAKPSLKMGQRLQKIATKLRNRAAAAGLKLFASVEFVVKSELSQLERRPASV